MLPQRCARPCLASLQRLQCCQQWLQTGKMGGGTVENRGGGNVCARKVCPWTQISECSIKMISVHWRFVSGTKWGTTMNGGLSNGGEGAWWSRARASAALLQEVPTSMQRLTLLSRLKGSALHCPPPPNISRAGFASLG